MIGLLTRSFYPSPAGPEEDELCGVEGAGLDSVFCFQRVIGMGRCGDDGFGSSRKEQWGRCAP